VRDINGDHAQVRLYCAATLLQRLSTWIMLYRARVRVSILSTNMVLVLVGFKLLRKTWLNEVNAPSADTHHIQHNTNTSQHNTTHIQHTTIQHQNTTPYSRGNCTTHGYNHRSHSLRYQRSYYTPPFHLSERKHFCCLCNACVRAQMVI